MDTDGSEREGTNATYQERTRQRIRGMRAANPMMAVREIASLVGVSVSYAEEALGERQAPEWVA